MSIATGARPADLEALIKRLKRERAFGVAARIDSGTVWVNQHFDVGLDIPFGGAKQSGLGAQLGQEGLEEFTQATVINMRKP